MKQDQFLERILPLQPRLQLMAERLLGSSAEAEDAVQDTVATLWEKRNELDCIVNIEGFAMQSLKNRCLTLLRHQHKYVDTKMFEVISDDDIRRETELVEERSRQLDHMMERLPEVQRRAVQMRYIDRLSHEEMQRRLGLSSSNVYTILSRAVSALKTMNHGR